MNSIRYCLLLLSLMATSTLLAQQDSIRINETMEEYIKENHLEQIEDVIHKFTSSRVFVDFLLKEGHNITTDSEIKRKDVRVGRDLDVYVKHFTEHQNFTMILIPIDIYSELIYDTLLFSILEVSNDWLYRKFHYHDLSNDSIRTSLLSLENHDMLARHMYEQASKAINIGMAETEVHLHEGYISSSTINLHTSELTKEEKKEFRQSWGLLKKALTHDVNLNVEMNVYIFGKDDMNIVFYSKGKEIKYQVTPSNIFTHHAFVEK